MPKLIKWLAGAMTITFWLYFLVSTILDYEAPRVEFPEYVTGLAAVGTKVVLGPSIGMPVVAILASLFALRGSKLGAVILIPLAVMLLIVSLSVIASLAQDTLREALLAAVILWIVVASHVVQIVFCFRQPESAVSE